MMQDGQNLYSDSQGLSGPGERFSDNTVDHGKTWLFNVPHIGRGEPLGVLISVLDDLGGTLPTFQVKLQTDDVEMLTVNPTDVATSRVYTALARGDKIVLGLSPEVRRYTRLNYTLGGTLPTISVQAALMPLKAIESFARYRDGFSIT